jgi:hypothetical protein
MKNLAQFTKVAYIAIIRLIKYALNEISIKRIDFYLLNAI